MNRILIFLASLLLAGAVNAQTVDCTLSQGGGRSDIPTNTGESTVEPINHQAGVHFYLFRPDMSCVPGGATITGAVFRVYSEVAFNGGALSLYNMLLAWVSGETSWNNYSTGNAWNTAGASGSGTDRSASTIGTYTLLSSDDGVFIEIAVDTATVIGWLTSNNGFGFFSDGSVFADFSGVTDATNPPRLRVTYTTAGGAPQRTTLGAGR